MFISTILDQLETTLTRPSPHHDRALAEARSRHCALSPYGTTGAILAACRRGSRLSIEERDAILAAIVTELQLAGTASAMLWQSLLLVTFAPMLVRLRSMLKNPDSDELDQHVLLAFLESARSLRCRTFVPRHLALDTKARLFNALERERRHDGLTLFDEADHLSDPLGVEAERHTEAVRIVRILEAKGGPELHGVFRAACEDDESVQDYVDRAYADRDDRTRAREGKRLRQSRLEVFAELRAEAAA